MYNIVCTSKWMYNIINDMYNIMSSKWYVQYYLLNDMYNIMSSKWYVQYYPF